MKKITLLIILSFYNLTQLVAQADNKTAAISALKKLSSKYLEAPFLSFDIAYYYAAQESPAVYLDSLKGSFKMNGPRYWYLLDSTETIADTSTVVVLYREDKIMYLSKASAAPQGMGPLTMLDSFLDTDKSLEYQLSTSGAQQIISIQFPLNSAYREIKYYVDAVSGLVEQTIALVKTEQLYEPEARSQLKSGNEYSIIETRFTHYQQNSFDRKILNTGHYFKKDGATITVTPLYSMYKIFLGKPGM